MEGRIKKAFDALIAIGAPVKEWHNDERGHFWLSAEEETSELFLDYYSLYEGSEKLNEVLTKYGLYFEWENAAVGCVYDA